MIVKSQIGVQIPILTSGILFCVSLIFLMSGCDKDVLDSENWEEQQNISVVQTEWNSEAEDETPVEMDQTDEVIEPMLPESEPLESVIADDEIQELPYSVQVGAFLKRHNADNLISKLEKKGYEPVLIKTKTTIKEWNIVRIGSFADKQSAIEAAKSLTQSENMETAVVMNNAIVSLARAEGIKSVKRIMPDNQHQPEVKTTEEKSGESGSFAFQIGGLRTKPNAEKFKAQLSKQGYAPYIVKITSAYGSDIWYTVRIGHYDDIDSAATAADDFMNRENIPAQAVAAEE